MFSIFKFLKRQSFYENKVVKFFFLAIVELSLVFIGIILAFYFDEVKEIRVQNELIHQYYRQIAAELDKECLHVELEIKGANDVNRKLILCQNATQFQNLDSLNLLRDNIGSATAFITFKSDLQIYSEFIDTKLLHDIKDIEIKAVISNIEYYRSYISRLEDYSIQQYTNIVEPYFVEHINVTELGPNTNWNEIIGSMEFWNIIRLRIETNRFAINFFEHYLKELKELKSLLKKRIK